MQLYQVDVSRSNLDSIKVIKALRIIGGVSLKEASQIFTYINMHKTATIAAGLSKHVAERIAEELTAQQIDARSTISSVKAPMLLDERVEKIFEWTRLRRLRAIKL